MANVGGDGREFPGKAALVTGAARGIGLAIAKELAGRRCTVYMLDIKQATLDDSARALKADGMAAEPIVCDLSDQHELAAAVAHVRDAGGVDILVNNASVVPPVKPLQDVPAAAVERAMAVNLTAPIELCRLLLPDLVTRPRAWIVNICSQSARYMPLAYFGTYVATKAGLAMFSECLRQELAESSVRVLRVEPGKVRSEGYLETDLTLMPGGGGRSKPVEPAAMARAIVQAMLRGRTALYYPPMNKFVLAFSTLAPRLLRTRTAKDQLARARRNT